MKEPDEFPIKPQPQTSCLGDVRRRFYCLKCKEEVIYLDEDIDIMQRVEENEGVFCSDECEYSFYNSGDGSNY